MINGKQYIGKTCNVDKRWKAHKALSLNKSQRSYAIHSAIQKYGIEFFEFAVLREGLTNEVSSRLEVLYIADLQTKYPNGYNLTDGGEGSVGYKPTPETLVKMSAVQKGKIVSAAARASISAGLRGKSRKPITDTHRANMSASHKGKSHSDSHRAKISEALKSKSLDPTFQHPLKGRKQSPEAIKLRFAGKARKKLERSNSI